MYCGSFKIDDNFTFYCQTQGSDSGALDADSAPTYRVYEDETTTPILTGTMALLDAANTNGFYSKQITLSAANGFEKGKCYCIRLSAAVAAIVGATLRFVQIQAEVAVASMNANVMTAAAAAADLTTELQSGLATVGAAMTLTSAYDFAKGTVAMTESYAAPGVVPTPVQAILATRQKLMQFSISGTAVSVYKVDNVTVAFTTTLNSSTTPTSDRFV